MGDSKGVSLTLEAQKKSRLGDANSTSQENLNSKPLLHSTSISSSLLIRNAKDSLNVPCHGRETNP